MRFIAVLGLYGEQMRAKNGGLALQNDRHPAAFGSLISRIVGAWPAPTTIVLAAIVTMGCTSAPPASSSPAITAGPGLPTTPPSATLSAASPEPSPTVEPTGFAFPETDVQAYYESIGYACSVPRPSTKADGYNVVTCQLIDSAGRTRVIGLVTDGTGELGNGFAAVWAAAGVTYLDPADAIDPLAAFLGTMLGERRGGDAADWLRVHLGAKDDRTMIDAITIATYTGQGDDPSELYVELANPAYLEASPPPSP
jgi:hypothetical protein